MTLREFELVCLGRSDEQERTLDLAAVHASWIMNVWTKRKIKPGDLYKRRGDEAEDFVEEIKRIRGVDGKEQTPEEAQASFEAEMNERAQRARRRAYWRDEGVIDP